MEVAAERYFGLVRGPRSEHILRGSVSDERQRTRPKEPQPGGFLQKRPSDFVVLQILRIFSFVTPRRRAVFGETAISIVF
jgi:hypothetical protein